MFLPLAPILVLMLSDGRPVQQNFPSPGGSVRLMSVYWQDQSTNDPKAERELFDLANRARAQAGMKPFRIDDGLTRAARQHAALMAERGELSHQFSGEPDLSQRLAKNCSLFLVEAAENVALSQSADRAHDGLMHSVHHRENLLHPSYNVVGIGVVNRAGKLYVVQDFGNALSTSSPQDAERGIGDSINQPRRQAHLAVLEKKEANLRDDACALAAQDSLKATGPSPAGARSILRYTSMQPGTLPDAASKAISDEKTTGYSAGACFARSKSYPSGIYWIVLVFY